MQKSASMLALFCFTSLRKQAEQAVQFTLHVPQNQRFDEAKVQGARLSARSECTRRRRFSTYFLPPLAFHETRNARLRRNGRMVRLAGRFRPEFIVGKQVMFPGSQDIGSREFERGARAICIDVLNTYCMRNVFDSESRMIRRRARRTFCI
ncbi:hypothetical protein ACMX25_08195 [Caballeronia sp. 15715]|uniref:hypothetical protein n=1 Tax=Caballeronia sp. 15715 TaxID=3391030 RepID=UPI0039E55CB6